MCVEGRRPSFRRAVEYIASGQSASSCANERVTHCLLNLSANVTFRASLQKCTVTMAAKDGKWRGSVTEVIPAPIEKVWTYLTDFDGLQKHFPDAFTSCDTVEGEVNKIGSVRALVAPLPDGNNLECTERLLHQDDVNYTTSYGMEKTNTGWTGYVGHISAKSFENGQTLVEWGFEVDPISAISEEQYAAGPKGLFGSILQTLKGLVSK